MIYERRILDFGFGIWVSFSSQISLSLSHSANATHYASVFLLPTTKVKVQIRMHAQGVLLS